MLSPEPKVCPVSQVKIITDDSVVFVLGTGVHWREVASNLLQSLFNKLQ